MSRPRSVTAAVALMYVGGAAQVALGIATIFLRYTAEASTVGLSLLVTLLGAGMILFGLFVVALASGVARGSRASRVAATAVLLLGVALALADLVAVDDGDWAGVAVMLVASVVVIVPLWSGRGRRYFAHGTDEA